MLSIPKHDEGVFDFGEYFKENENDITNLIRSVCCKFRDRMDPDELFSEVIITLYNSKFNMQYDPNKSTFNTYFVTKVKGYISHIIEKTQRNENRNCMTGFAFHVIKSETRGADTASKRHLTSQFRTNGHSNVENIDSVHYSENTIEDDLMYSELFDLLMSKLPKEKERRMFCMIYQDGFTKLGDIAERLECSDAFITQLKVKIRDRLLPTLKKEGFNV